MRYTIYFDHPGPAWPVKIKIERAVRFLLPRDEETTAKLAFAGGRAAGELSFQTRLCLEAVTPSQRIYSLITDINSSRPGMPRETFIRLSSMSSRAMAAGLVVVPGPGPNLSVSALYAEVFSEGLEDERRQAEFREDPVLIEAVRREVLAAIRAGRKCAQANKEGQTNFYFDGGQLIRDHVGEWEACQAFATETEFLANLRNFYIFDPGCDTYPHAPLELDVWRYIQSQLS